MKIVVLILLTFTLSAFSKTHTKKTSQTISIDSLLKYRSQQSITDSIEKRYYELNYLYKKQLKITPKILGTIWFEIVINTNGNIDSISLNKISSTIDSSDYNFKQPFIDTISNFIIHNINFKQIPDSLGKMRINYPFEFYYEQRKFSD